MTVRASTRFEVFKRDRFTCAYCGRTPPEVLLHADHIHPVSAGGTDDLDNLITACSDCNLGKGARLLEAGVRPAIDKPTVEELSERIEQAKAYMELLGARAVILDEQAGMVTEHWATLFGATLEERADGSWWMFKYTGDRFPDKASVRRFLRHLSTEIVLEAVEITASNFARPSHTACRYFYGICWRRIRGEGGRDT